MASTKNPRPKVTSRRRPGAIDVLLEYERAGEDGVPYCVPAALAERVDALTKSATGKPGVADQRRFEELKPFIEEAGRETIALPPTGRAKKGKDVEIVRYRLNERGKARVAEERKKADEERKKAVAARRGKLAKSLKVAEDLRGAVQNHSTAVAELSDDIAATQAELGDVARALEASDEHTADLLADHRRSIESAMERALAAFKDDLVREIAEFNPELNSALGNRIAALRTAIDGLADRVSVVVDESRALSGATQDRLDSLLDSLAAALDGDAPVPEARATAPEGNGSAPAGSATFAKAYDAFRARCKELSRRFVRDKSVRKEVEDEARDFAAGVSGAAEQTAAELAGAIEIGALRHADDGEVWRSHGLGAFSTKDEAQRILNSRELSVGDLRTVGQLLKLGLGERTVDGLKKETVLEVDKRALYR